MILSLVSKRYPNNTNLNITNTTTTTKREKDAVVAVDFKKLKEKGEERMGAIRERMVELDFKEEFIEKMLKEYSVKKVEEKLELLMERRNIQNPAGWLRTALKRDYRDPESPNVIANDLRECGNLNSQIPSPPEGNILSTEEARERFKFLRHELMAMN